MYLLHRKKIDNYVNISLFLSYYEVTVATRSSPYPAQRVTAVTRSSPYSDPMVDQHLETTFKAPTALNVSGVQDTKMSPRDRSPVRNPSHTQPLGKKTLEPVKTLQSDSAAVGTNYWFVWSEGNWPPNRAWLLPRFFLHSVADGVLVPCRCRLWLA